MFQRNRRIYLQEEDKLESIVSDQGFRAQFQRWLEVTIGQLDLQFELCEQHLSELQQNVAVEPGNYWSSKTIIQHCNLHISDKRLVAAGAKLEQQHATLPEAVNLISCLQQLKSQIFITPKQRKFIEQSEAELRNVFLEHCELLFITNALRTKLQDDGNTRGVFGELTNLQNAIEELSPDIDQCEQLLEASIANGEMGLAEEISKRQMEIYERILTLITDQYPIIMNYHSDSCDSDRRRRWAIFRMADKDITAVIERKYRQIEACEEDLIKIKEQIENYNNDDLHQRKRYDAERNLSDDFLQKNKEKQQGVWNRIFELYEELGKCQDELMSLARQRRKEVNRRLEMEEHEAGRRSGHMSFISAAAAHAEKLQNMINNAVAVKKLATALNNFVLDGCDSITGKYDKQQNALNEMLRLVQQHHFRRFSDYYIVASRYLYRKERRLEHVEKEIVGNTMKKEILADQLDPSAKCYAEYNNDLLLKRREVSQEVFCVRHKLEKAEQAIEQTLRLLQFAGIEYVHPRDIVEKINLNRCSTILDYRELMSPSVPHHEKVRMEELIKLAELRTAITAETKGRLAQQRHRLPAISKKENTQLHRRVNALLEKQITDSAQTTSLTSAAATTNFTSNAALGSERPQTTVRTSLTGGGGGGGSGAAGAITNTATVEGAESVEGSAAMLPRNTRIEGMTMRALYPYKARAPDELTFNECDLIVCVSRAQEEGWFKGVCNQRTGLFPINYVVPHEEGC